MDETIQKPDFLDTAARLRKYQSKPPEDDAKILERLDLRFGKKDEMAHTSMLQGTGTRQRVREAK
jgi:hypothetical protein